MTKCITKAALCVFILTGVPALASAQLPNTCDFDGDGKTDPVIVRNAGGGQIQWWISRSTDGLRLATWGTSADFFVCGDYDFDGKSDITVWRSGAAGVAGFWVLQSSNGAMFFEPFGQTGDIPTMVGDYNGDNRDDFAVYRPGASVGAQSVIYYRTTQGGPVNFVPWGVNGDDPTALDYDGDGRHDPLVRRGSGQNWVRRSSDGATVLFYFGNATDLLVPGTWDADATEDLAVVRSTGGQYQHWTRATSTGAVSVVSWGSSATDFVTQGDWDGDGRTDRAVWRSGGTGRFWISRSTGGTAIVTWGTTADYPVNNWRVR